MAITALEITQNNSSSGIYLMSIHNPLVFIIKATWNTTIPDVIYVEINTEVYKCIYLNDESATERNFYFVADEILRKELGYIIDIAQSPDTIIAIPNLSSDITLLFADDQNFDNITATITVSVVNAANDFESTYGAAMVNEYNNATKNYIGIKDELLYLYWYNNDAANTIVDGVSATNYALITLNVNISAGEKICIQADRVYKLSNPICGADLSVTITEGVDYSAGLTISATIDNIIVALGNNAEFDCFTISKVGTDAIKLLDNTNWFTSYTSYSCPPAGDYTITKSITNGAPSAIAIIFDNNLADGEVVAFGHYNLGVITYPNFTAKNTPTLATHFQIGATKQDTFTNYITLLQSTYPTLYADYLVELGAYYVFLQDEVLANYFYYAGGATVNWHYTVTDPVAITGGVSFAKGFIRKAIEPASLGSSSEGISINAVSYPHNINVMDLCTGGIILKYLDRIGQYRFLPFVSMYKRTVSPENIGEVNELITSILTDKSDTRPIGYKNKDTLTLTAVSLSESELLLMKDLYTSSDIQIYINSKWIRVTIQGDNIIKQPKGKYKDITITVNMPKSYNITEL